MSERLAYRAAENATAHLLVPDHGREEPVGIPSALDVARAFAPEEAPATEQTAPRRVYAGDRLIITPTTGRPAPRRGGPGGG